MAKTSKYNRQDIIHKATNLYWEKGFHGTSMRNLQDVIDMRPGSIYAAFGSKEGLFKEALQHYTQQALSNLAQLKLTAGSPLKGLKRFVEMAVIESKTCSPSGMCMLTKTISELTQDNATLVLVAKKSLNEIEQHFKNTLVEAQVAGEIHKNKDTTQLARNLQVHIMGLRCYASINNNPVIVQQMIDNQFATF
ncbi:MAG: TetR/AcrR family transcriptional regulator [Psychromonas sp.]